LVCEKKKGVNVPEKVFDTVFRWLG